MNAIKTDFVKKKEKTHTKNKQSRISYCTMDASVPLLQKKKMDSYKDVPEQKCLQCGNDMGYGRSDRKFCCEVCKNRYNNSRRYVHSAYKEKINRELEKNYSILVSLVKMGIDQVPLGEAQSMGFNTHLVTAVTRTGRRPVFNYFCYDISFKISESRIFNIQRITLTLKDISSKK